MCTVSFSGIAINEATRRHPSMSEYIFRRGTEWRQTISPVLKGHGLLLHEIDCAIKNEILPYAGDELLPFKYMLITTIIFLVVYMENAVVNPSTKWTSLWT